MVSITGEKAYWHRVTETRRHIGSARAVSKKLHFNVVFGFIRRQTAKHTRKVIAKIYCNTFFLYRLLCPIHTARQTRQDSAICVVSGVAV